jgi:hypothetical protein
MKNSCEKEPAVSGKDDFEGGRLQTLAFCAAALAATLKHAEGEHHESP